MHFEGACNEEIIFLGFKVKARKDLKPRALAENEHDIQTITVQS